MTRFDAKNFKHTTMFVWRKWFRKDVCWIIGTRNMMDSHRFLVNLIFDVMIMHVNMLSSIVCNSMIMSERYARIIVHEDWNRIKFEIKIICES